ncbi:MAG: dTDP-4-dehydrorhamnose 3,5-epimerase family protein [Chitinophagaceae bacterium]|nr:MAG: dTDP-4-dehydrorhamnose 3,5-epimerase [Bacteroidetes bacterium OLB11]MCC6448737.1 dTDP-4-dehydrorhamnose 3,5-epimerase family protein [Chitinophagaceae bacterium]HMN32857.1 dTDP-4-dehydrorhamnose 3,5-epimerase family protein [Chitinophagaceae bacterium]
MNFSIENTNINAVKIVNLFKVGDHRGYFEKPFHYSDFKNNGIDFHIKESFFSVSQKNVIRGMHFHTPPFEHDKLVFCTRGSILDVALDLRKNEPTYQQYVSQILSEDNAKAMFIPKGFAHGFLTLTEQATAFYFISSEYVQEADGGVRYDSFGFDWNVDSPILSPRDLAFDIMEQFSSPF